MDIDIICRVPVVVSIISVRKASRTPDTVLCPIVFILQDEMLKEFQAYNQKTYMNSVLLFVNANIRYFKKSLGLYVQLLRVYR